MYLSIHTALIIAIIAIQTVAKESFEVDRDSITTMIMKNIRFEGELSKLSETERAAYLQRLDVEETAAAKIPHPVFAGNSDTAEIVLCSRITHLRYDDMELNHLTIEKALMDAVLVLEQTRFLPSLNEQDRKDLEESVVRTMNRANAIVSTHLSDIIPKDIIDKATQRITTDLIGRIGNITTYAMKRKPDAEELDQLLHVFEERLKLSRERAVTRLERAEQLMKKSEGNDNQTDIKLHEMERIIDEVLHPLQRSLLTATSPRELLKLNKNPDQILPGYSEVVKQWTERYNKVSNERFKQKREQQKQELKHQIMMQHLKAEADHIANHTIDASTQEMLNADAPTEPNVSTNLDINSQTETETPTKTETPSETENNEIHGSQGVSTLAIVSTIGLGTLAIAFLAILAINKGRRQKNASGSNDKDST